MKNLSKVHIFNVNYITGWGTSSFLALSIAKALNNSTPNGINAFQGIVLFRVGSIFFRKVWTYFSFHSHSIAFTTICQNVLFMYWQNMKYRCYGCKIITPPNYTSKSILGGKTIDLLNWKMFPQFDSFDDFLFYNNTKPYKKRTLTLEMFSIMSRKSNVYNYVAYLRK